MDALKRRKQPALVRAALLDAVAQEAAQRGLGGVTVLGVAERAGVSKGALFHHFANRQQLLEAAYADCLLRFGDELDAIIARDTLAHGRFTRAYVTATFDAMQTEDRSWVKFSLTALVEPAFADLWRNWLAARLEAFPAERADPHLRAARLAADGFWLQMLGCWQEDSDAGKRQVLLQCILELTKGEGSTR